MKVKFVFEIEMDVDTMKDAEREARSIRDTYFIPEAFSGLRIYTDADGEQVTYDLNEDDNITQDA